MSKTYGRKLDEIGYHVHPICPPDVTVYGWDNRGTKEKPDWHEVIAPNAPGKAPGQWTGSKWRTKKGWRSPSPWSAVYDSWQGSGVGVLCGGDLNIIGLDFDITHTDASRYIYAKMWQTFGKLPVRVGQPPKFLIPARSANPIGKFTSDSFSFAGHPKLSRLEVLASGQQFVAYGTHPTTGLPYQWYVQSLVDVPPDKLRVFTSEELTAIKSFVTEVLIKFGGTKVADGSFGRTRNAKVNRKNLYAEDPDDVVQLLRLIPVGQDREARVQVAHNIVGALGKNDASKELWFLWCEQVPEWRREDGEVVWASIRPDRIQSGINALYEKAEPYLEALIKQANAGGANV